MRAPKTFVAPVLPRVTAWTLEKISALPPKEIKQLRANADRLHETEIAALCEKALKTMRERKSP